LSQVLSWHPCSVYPSCAGKSPTDTPGKEAYSSVLIVAMRPYSRRLRSQRGARKHCVCEHPLHGILTPPAIAPISAVAAAAMGKQDIKSLILL
jgi:hypothetical protein